MANDEQWHLDKKVPLSLIFAMIVQAAMVLWAVAGIRGDVEILKVKLQAQTSRADKQDQSSAESLSLIRGQLDKMENKLDRALERRP